MSILAVEMISRRLQCLQADNRHLGLLHSLKYLISEGLIKRPRSLAAYHLQHPRLSGEWKEVFTADQEQRFAQIREDLIQARQYRPSLEHSWIKARVL